MLNDHTAVPKGVEMTSCLDGTVAANLASKINGGSKIQANGFYRCGPTLSHSTEEVSWMHRAVCEKGGSAFG